MATISDLSNIQKGSTWFGFSVTASGLSSTSKVYSMRVIGDVSFADDKPYAGPSFSKAFSFTGLTPGTTYSFRVVIFVNGGATDISRSFTVTTDGTAPDPDPDPEPTPEEIRFSLEATDITDTSVSLRAYGLPRRSGTRTFHWRAIIGHVPVVSETSNVSASNTSATYTLTGLKPETRYLIIVAFENKTDNSRGTEDIAITTLSSSVEPEPDPGSELWDWGKQNGIANVDLTFGAYTALTQKGPVAAFSYLVWNDLVNKVEDVQIAKGGSWKSGIINKVKYLTVDETRMSLTDKVLTADRFNSLRYNVGYYQSTGVGVKQKGDPVIGADFIKITDALNIWIQAKKG